MNGITLWDEWLMLFAIFVAPEIPAVVLAIVGLVGIKGRSRQTEAQHSEQPKTTREAEDETPLAK